MNKIAAHYSVVIFTHNVKKADECLKYDMFIKESFYHLEKYISKLNITQYYKCYKFEHLTKHCKNKQKCENCEKKDHDITNCINDIKCAKCENLYLIWYIECSKHDEEENRLKALK